MPKRKKGFLDRLRPASITFQAYPPFVALTYETKKKASLSKRRYRKSKNQPQLNPIQEITLPKIEEAKRQANLAGRAVDATFLSAIEYAVKDPKGFKKFMRDLGRLISD